MLDSRQGKKTKKSMEKCSLLFFRLVIMNRNVGVSKGISYNYQANCIRELCGLQLCCLSILFFFNSDFWLCWVFVSVRGLSLVAASGGHSSSRCAGLSLSRPLLLRNTGSRRAGSVVVAHGLSCSTACGIFPDQGSNPCPLHWQADSQPLRHQGSPVYSCFFESW